MITTRDILLKRILERKKKQAAIAARNPRLARSINSGSAPASVSAPGRISVPVPVLPIQAMQITGGGPGEHPTALTPTGGGGVVTGITVCHNTRLLLQKAYGSIRKFYPDMPIIIVECSDPGNSTVGYAQGLASPLTTVIRPGSNIGHGPGMNLGINYCQTRYALMFDTDAELLEPCVGDMLAMMEDDTFGVGYNIPTALSGFGTWAPAPPPKEGGWMSYLHPYFCLIDTVNYKKYVPFKHSGAPCTPTMRDIYNKGLSGKIIKQFKDMANGTPKYVKHDGGGTCRRNPKLCT